MLEEERLRYLERVGEDQEEADRLDDFPHPREMLDLVGHAEAEQELLENYRSGRLHHAWILGGAEGIGKATLAYRFARFILTNPDSRSEILQSTRDLYVPSTAREARLVAGQAHPDLYVLRRNWNVDRKTLFSEIRVADVAKVNHLFGSTASAGGWRVAIVDNVEDLNANSANALLKILEEPPSRSIFLLISNAPGRLMATLRSRCRMLPMRPLEQSYVQQIIRSISPDELNPNDLEQAAAMSHGSVRRGLRNLDADALALRKRLQTIFASFPTVDEKSNLAIAEETARRDGTAFGHFFEMTEDYLSQSLHRLANAPVAQLQAFAQVHQALLQGRQDIETYNLDRRPLVISALSQIADAVRKSSA